MVRFQATSIGVFFSIDLNKNKQKKEKRTKEGFSVFAKNTHQNNFNVCAELYFILT